MAINIEIKSIKKTDNLDITNVVTTISYRLTKELNGKTASVDGEANLDFTNVTEDNYIPISGLTKTIINEWILNCIGDRITSIEEYLDMELTPQEEQRKIVSTEINLPWETN